MPYPALLRLAGGCRNPARQLPAAAAPDTCCDKLLAFSQGAAVPMSNGLICKHRCSLPDAKGSCGKACTASSFDCATLTASCCCRTPAAFSEACHDPRLLPATAARHCCRTTSATCKACSCRHCMSCWQVSLSQRIKMVRTHRWARSRSLTSGKEGRRQPTQQAFKP
jgi:hypothetical protein